MYFCELLNLPEDLFGNLGKHFDQPLTLAFEPVRGLLDITPHMTLYLVPQGNRDALPGRRNQVQCYLESTRTSVAVLAEISLRSPHKLIIFIIKK